MSRSKNGSLAVQFASLILTLSGNALAKQDFGIKDIHEDASMKLERGTLLSWMLMRETQNEASSDLGFASLFEAAPVKSAQLAYPPSHDLSVYLPLDPRERDQGRCQNCYAWAGTGAMEIALTLQRGFSSSTRLSVQYYNSCRCEGGTNCISCHPLNLQHFVNWYKTSGKAIPWSNYKASFNDKNISEWDESTLDCREIDEWTRDFPIVSIDAQKIDTVLEGVSDPWIAQRVAISRIKDVLLTDRPVVFSMHLRSQSDFKHFLNWWRDGRESDVLDVDQYCVTASEGGGASTSEKNAGHTMLIVGYNDDPQEPYWIVLNSLGTPDGRQNQMFRMKMNMDYRCHVYDAGQVVPARWFDTLNIRYGLGSSS
ncbi:C1 family peptidase [Sorangium sp. So ce406]|uniref:C1 family peptidase n=1 Tax=Sorangium sp. So ce406 TaxID=3133311 RepID=UPI003F5CB63D